jgi:adenosylcobinamide-GDP ribazoletransferase
LVLVTGGLHEDGLADCADGLGGTTPARRLEIMRDPRVGSFGVIALALGLLARVGALGALQHAAAVATALIVAAVLSRAAIPVAMLALPNARADGLAARAGRPHAARVAAAVLIALALVLVLLPPRSAVIVTACVAAAGGLLAIAAWRRLGGRTGDVLGALQQVTEIAALLALAALRQP